MGVPELFFSLPTREVMQAIWAVKYSQHEKASTIGSNSGGFRAGASNYRVIPRIFSEMCRRRNSDFVEISLMRNFTIEPFWVIRRLNYICVWQFIGLYVLNTNIDREAIFLLNWSYIRAIYVSNPYLCYPCFISTIRFGSCIFDTPSE